MKTQKTSQRKETAHFGDIDSGVVDRLHQARVAPSVRSDDAIASHASHLIGNLKHKGGDGAVFSPGDEHAMEEGLRTSGTHNCGN